MSYLELDKEVYYDDIFKAADNDDRLTFRELFLQLHERDQHEVFELFYPENKKKISNFLLAEEFAEIFEWLEIEDQEDAVAYLPDSYIAQVFNELANDDVVYFITQSEKTDNESLLKMMDETESERVREILSYAADTAGSIMTKEFISIDHKMKINDVMKELRQIGRQAETIYYNYVVDDRKRLVGVLSLRDIMFSPEDENVENIMFNQIISVRVDQDQEEVAQIIQDYDLLAVPVVSHDGRMQGIVTVDDVIDIIEEEAEEDFIEFAGVMPSDTDEKEETALSAAKSRTPWIVILLFLGLITGGLIGAFEETLESVVMLSTFIPMIMGTAGNIGTQSLAVSVTNLDSDKENGKSFWKTVFDEFRSGLVIGVIIAIVLSIVVFIIYGNSVLAFIVSATMLIVTSLAAVVGVVIPAIINKFNIDPAVASGPFITAINDSFGILIYFAIATSLLQYL